MIALKLNDDTVKLDGVRYENTNKRHKLTDGSNDLIFANDNGEVILVLWTSGFRRIRQRINGSKKWTTPRCNYAEV